MADTLGDMKTRIADEIARGDLTSQIALCINDAIKIYQKKRFRFSDSSFQFATIAGQETYDSSTNSNIASLYLIDFLDYQLGITWLHSDQIPPEQVQLANSSQTFLGPPSAYSYFAQKIRFTPIPSQAFQIYVAGVLVVAAPASDAETGNPWMTDAERLIRCRAKYELAVHYTKDTDLAAMMSPDEPAPGQKAGQCYEAYEELKAETNILTGLGRIIPTQF